MQWCGTRSHDLCDAFTILVQDHWHAFGVSGIRQNEFSGCRMHGDVLYTVLYSKCFGVFGVRAGVVAFVCSHVAVCIYMPLWQPSRHEWLSIAMLIIYIDVDWLQLAQHIVSRWLWMILVQLHSSHIVTSANHVRLSSLSVVSCVAWLRTEPVVGMCASMRVEANVANTCSLDSSSIWIYVGFHFRIECTWFPKQ